MKNKLIGWLIFWVRLWPLYFFGQKRKQPLEVGCEPWNFMLGRVRMRSAWKVRDERRGA